MTAGQMLEHVRYLESRQDARFSEILASLQGRFDRFDASQRDLSQKLTQVEKDVAFIRAAGTVIVVLLTLASKVPESVWKELFQ